MTQVKSAQDIPRQVALRKRADDRTLAQRRAAFAAQMRDMALSDLAQLSKRLKDLHQELEDFEGRKWTQMQLAEKMKIPYRTFQSWENGEVENEDGKGYDKIGRFYSRKLGRKITRQWILFGDAKPDPKPRSGGGSAAAEPDRLSRIEENLKLLAEGQAEILEGLAELREPPKDGRKSQGRDG
jgi:transcriptional regulator with XRE-family HTH domain